MSRPMETEQTGPPPAPDRDELLGEAIEDYLALVESGQAPDADEYAARYPDIRDDLRAALDGLAVVQGLVGESGSGPGGRLEAGRRVAGYRIVRELGRGGMGIVYEAVHVDLDRPVALKVLGMHAAPDSTGRRRFLNEAKTAASLHHTHIVPVFDVGQVGGLCYYAMQRIEGCGLDRVIKALRKGRSTGAGSATGRPSAAGGAAATVDLLNASALGDPTRSWLSAANVRRAGGPVPNDERCDEAPPFEPPRGAEYYRWVARAGAQAADALAHAHRRGVIHRDVKPSNILVDARGTVWVADFGLARRISDPSVTQTESLIGTPRYMSPEQALQRPIEPLTDVYSLGATLYELLTLRPPHDGKSTAELIGQIRDREPIAPRRIDPRLPRDLETIVLKAMAKRPQDRYASAQDLAEDLERFLATEPVRARRIGPLGRAWRFARRHPSLTAVSTIAAASILITATVAYVRVVQERNKAVKAGSDLELALGRETVVNEKLRAARLQDLWREASSIRQMRRPELRKTGLARLSDAVELRPDEEMRTRLRDEAVQLLALRDIEPQQPWLPTGRASRAAFVGTPDRLAVLSENGAELAIWNASRRERTALFPLPSDAGDEGHGPPGRPRDRTWFGPIKPPLATAGSTVAAAYPNGEGVRLFDLDSGVYTDLSRAGHRVVNLALTGDGRRLITVEAPGTNVRPGPAPGGANTRPAGEGLRVWLWDTKSRDEPIANLALPEPRPDSPPGFRPSVLAVSPDGKTIATALWFESTIGLWAAEDGKKLGEVTAEGRITNLALGADGTLAVACNGTVLRWDVASLKPLPGLSLHQPILWEMRLSPSDGASMLAVVGPFNSVELWDPEANSLLATVPTTERVGDIAFSPDGQVLAAVVGGSTRLWAMVEPIGRTRLAAPETRPAPRLMSLAFSPAGALAATFSNGKAHSALLQCRDGGTTPRERLRTLAVGFAPSGRLVVPDGEALGFYTSPRDTTAERIVPLPAGAASDPRPATDAPAIFGFQTSADGRAMVVFRSLGFNRGYETVLARFDAPAAPPTLTLVRPATDHRDGPGFGPFRGNRKPGGGPSLGSGGPPPSGGNGPGASGGGPGGDQPFGNLASFSIGPAGDRFYATVRRGEARAWQIDGDRAREVPWATPHRDVSRTAASPDGRSVALGHSGGRVSVVSTADGSLLAAIGPPSDSDAVTALAYSRTGELAVGYRSGLVRLWRIAPSMHTTLLVTLPSHQGEIKALAYAPDGRRLAAGDDSGADIWDLDQVRQRLDAIGLGW